jgi:hypothetical protein
VRVFKFKREVSNRYTKGDNMNTMHEAIQLANIIALLMTQKNFLDKQITTLKKDLEAKMVVLENDHLLTTEVSKNGKQQKVLAHDNFSCKIYTRVNTSMDKKKAKKLLHPNTFKAIFKQSISKVIDVRPSKKLIREHDALQDL